MGVSGSDHSRFNGFRRPRLARSLVAATSFHLDRACGRADGLFAVCLRPMLWLWPVLWLRLWFPLWLRLRFWMFERVRLSAADVRLWIFWRWALLLAVRLVLCAQLWRSLRRAVWPGLCGALRSDVWSLLWIAVRRRTLRLLAVLR